MTLPWSTDMGGWVCNSFNMISPAMKPMNLELLWAGAEPAGENMFIPGGGTVPVEWFDTQAVHAIVMQLSGEVDHAGTGTSSRGAGLAANHAAVVTALRRSAWGGLTCVSTVTRPDTVVVAGPTQVTVGPLGPETGGRIAKFLVTVTIPAGELVVVP